MPPHPSSITDSLPPAPSAAKTPRKPKSVAPVRQFAQMTGLTFFSVDPSTGAVLSASDDRLLPVLPHETIRWLALKHSKQVLQLESGLTYYAMPLPKSGRTHPLAVGYVKSSPDARPIELTEAAEQRNWSPEKLDSYLSTIPCIPTDQLETIITLATQNSQQTVRLRELNQDVDELSFQIERTYEEITLLHGLTHNLQISRSPVEIAELCLSRLDELIGCDGHAVWIQNRDDEHDFRVQGDLPLDEFDFVRLVDRYRGRDWSRPLVENHIVGTLLGADFPGLKSLVIVPISKDTHGYGWLISCNIEPGRQFGTVEGSLLNSVATILATHIRNIDLYRQHDDLLVGFVKSMVSTLDAKDPYTRGHSERVALIARRLGEDLGLPPGDLDDIYLSGLLHDIGKIGVDDRILRKPDRLTDDEFAQVKKHPLIGYDILRGLTNLQRVLPGVRNHHEHYNGNGYPDALSGDQIPLMARIIAVADSYDAMCKDRPYRAGLMINKIESILKNGRGKQWDPRVIDAYFRVRDDIVGTLDSESSDAGLNSGLIRLYGVSKRKFF